eukprot:IDg12568t1
MAHSSAKKLAKANALILNKFLWVILGTNSFFGGIRAVWYHRTFGSSQTGAWVTCGAVQLVAFGFLYASARPTYQNGALVDGGMDIRAGGGVMEYVRDILYVSLVVHVLCIFSSYALLGLLIVPAYAIYGIISARSSMPDFGGMAQQEQTAPLSRKERRKQERDARKVPQY